MSFPPGWTSPITVPPGQIQRGVDPARLLPSRPDLIQSRLDGQRRLLATATRRFTLIEVTPDGVIWDGHHGARVALEAGAMVEVRVVDESLTPASDSLGKLPVR